MGIRQDKAVEFFMNGANCAQAVVCAFADKMGVDEATAMKIGAGLGGGIGRLREVCGTVGGMAVVMGFLEGSTDPADAAKKGSCYAEIQKIATRFKEENGSIICRELLGLSPAAATPPTPDARTPAYYKKRPCVELVRMMAGFIEEKLGE